MNSVRFLKLLGFGLQSSVVGGGFCCGLVGFFFFFLLLLHFWFFGVFFVPLPPRPLKDACVIQMSIFIFL